MFSFILEKYLIKGLLDHIESDINFIRNAKVFSKVPALHDTRSTRGFDCSLSLLALHFVSFSTFFPF
jgi:hypothetical protein